MAQPPNTDPLIDSLDHALEESRKLREASPELMAAAEWPERKKPLPPAPVETLAAEPVAVEES